MNIADSCSTPALCEANASRWPSRTSAAAPAAAEEKPTCRDTASHRMPAIAMAIVAELARSAAAMPCNCRAETRRICSMRPTPESSSSTPMVISSLRPACQVIATPAAASRGISRDERPRPGALSS